MRWLTGTTWRGFSGRTKKVHVIVKLFVGRLVLLVPDCEFRQLFRILRQAFALPSRMIS